ncbi:metal ABC transporter permease [Nesterenkonia flava]|uniref:Metal ABC transporter permease n=1 Tax=Nesterenkonia flava TaxID=469799 RepID=A0ABU1FSR6_9MICC|nr:metal ABC transporter permease [Nesterenkonia flava]MDR5711653.1 metal ABC transporter permease [Nesterenkonia flava]
MIEIITAPFEYGFMVHALAAAVIASTVCGLLSAWLVLMGWSLMGEAIAHSVLPGVVLAYIFGAPMALGALIFGLLAVLIIGGLNRSTVLKRDTTLGVVFTTLFALGLVLISRTPSQTHLQHILFGNVLGTSLSTLVQIAVLAAVTATVLLVKRRDFTLLAFDRTHAHTIGLPVGVLSAVLLVLLAITTVTALQTLGVILVVAMLIIPGAAGFLVARTFGLMLTVSALVGGLAAVLGVYASWWLDVSTGGAIVLSASALFALAYLGGPHRGVVPRLLRRRRASSHPVSV